MTPVSAGPPGVAPEQAGLEGSPGPALQPTPEFLADLAEVCQVAHHLCSSPLTRDLAALCTKLDTLVNSNLTIPDGQYMKRSGAVILFSVQ